MNWLGELIQKHVSINDTVLDLGCGIFQAISSSLNRNKHSILHRNTKYDNLQCKSLLGVDVVTEYIDIAKIHYPVIKLDLSIMDNLDIFVNNSFDIVLALDVLEHLEITSVVPLITKMKEISRKKIIVYTPNVYSTNDKNAQDVWNIRGHFPTQLHKSYISPELLTRLKFDLIYPKPDKNTFGVWNKGA